MTISPNKVKMPKGFLQRYVKMISRLVVLLSVIFFTSSIFALTLKSSAFEANKPIPIQYTCAGDDQPVPLSWENSPAGTQSFALVLTDPDAPLGVWTHWLVYNIPNTENSLYVKDPNSLPAGTLSGKNSWQHTDYQGPCPPSGTHRYFFVLYALNQMLSLPANATREELEKAMKGHVLARAQLMGTYQRK
jgi:Raf kinase inhibitor-like YbhB/YbcL family protein